MNGPGKKKKIKKKDSGGSYGTSKQAKGTYKESPFRVWMQKNFGGEKGMSCGPHGCNIKEYSKDSKQKDKPKKNWRETKKNVLKSAAIKELNLSKVGEKHIAKLAKEGESFGNIKNFFTGRQKGDQDVNDIMIGNKVLNRGVKPEYLNIEYKKPTKTSKGDIEDKDIDDKTSTYTGIA
tara:strand:- start:252 stop:785 length:534 start_codon:yes stop_codon:yes gene_type:complete